MLRATIYVASEIRRPFSVVVDLANAAVDKILLITSLVFKVSRRVLSPTFGHQEMRVQINRGSNENSRLGPIDIQDSNRQHDVSHEFPESKLELVGWQGGMI
jgi:hypothetical protein